MQQQPGHPSLQPPGLQPVLHQPTAQATMQHHQLLLQQPMLAPPGQNHSNSNRNLYDDLTCPIQLVLMVKDPVLASDGHTYEREAIEAWFVKARMSNMIVTSPVTGQPLDHLTLTPNAAIRKLAREMAQGGSNKTSLNNHGGVYLES